jgi:hypothetical protein
MTDYIATGKVVPERIAAIVGGIADACEQAGSPSSAARPPSTPACSARRIRRRGRRHRRRRARRHPRPHRVSAGDVVLALASSGLHSNGFSLVRRVDRRRRLGLDRHVEEFGRTLGEELLTPTRVYAADLLALLRDPRRRRRTSTRSPTSPAAGWPPTSPGSSPPGCTPGWTARPGPRPRLHHDRAARLGAGAGPRAHPQHGSRVSSRCFRKPPPTRRSRSWRRAAYGPGVMGQVTDAPTPPRSRTVCRGCARREGRHRAGRCNWSGTTEARTLAVSVPKKARCAKESSVCQRQGSARKRGPGACPGGARAPHHGGAHSRSRGTGEGRARPARLNLALRP